MASLSEKLRRERELRGISLKQISDDTKIGVRFLEALEEGRIELIPGEFYRRSYLRAYAKYLGLDEDRAVNAYAFSNQEKDADEDDESSSGQQAVSRQGMASWLPWLVVAGVAALVAIFFLRSGSAPAESAENAGASDVEPMRPNGDVADAARAPEPDDSASANIDGDGAGQASTLLGTTPPLTPPTPSRDDVPMLTPSSSSSPPARQTIADTPGDGRLRLVVAVGEACWLEIQADGEVVSTGLREEGFRQELTADSEMRLWLGNAGGVSFWVNGRPLRSLGSPGQVRDLSITPDNFMEFVAAEQEPS